MPPSRHPQIAEVIQQKSEEEMMDLLLKLNEGLNDIEQALEKELKDKQGESTSQPPDVIPIVSIVIPSTLGATLAPSIPIVTAEVVTGTGQGSNVNLSIEKLIKAMEEMRLQVSELK